MRVMHMHTVRHLVRAFIMAGFSYYISVLVKNGGIAYYIAPSMEIYVKLAAIALLVVAAYQGFLAVKTTWGETERAKSACECGDHHAYEHRHDDIAKPIKLKTLFDIACSFSRYCSDFFCLTQR